MSSILPKVNINFSVTIMLSPANVANLDKSKMPSGGKEVIVFDTSCKALIAQLVVHRTSVQDVSDLIIISDNFFLMIVIQTGLIPL